MSVLYFDIETKPIGGSELLGDAALHPESAAVHSLTVHDPDRCEGVVYLSSDSAEVIDKQWRVKSATEPELLELFWEGVADYDVLIGFGISHFDIPFLSARSALFELVETSLPKITDVQLLVTPTELTSQLLSLHDAVQMHGIQSTSVLTYPALSEAIAQNNTEVVVSNCIAKTQVLFALYHSLQVEQ